MSYEPKTFQNKAGDQKVANSLKQEIGLKFDGYKPVDGKPSEDATPAMTQGHEGTPQYDQGGSLPAATATVVNTSDQPEPVIPAHYEATGPNDL